MASYDSSQDMFEEPDTRDWLGVPLDQLRSSTPCTYPAVRPSNHHLVLFQVPVRENSVAKPYPQKSEDVWDENHVRMPQSPKSLFPGFQDSLVPRWPLIQRSLRNVMSSRDLENAIMSYNTKGTRNFPFDALHTFFSKTFDEAETNFFFAKVLPRVIDLALEIEYQFRAGVPLLKKGENRCISMTQWQAGILMANAFLCTFPRRSSTTPTSLLPTINFTRLFQCGSLESVQQKLKCFVNYFRRITTKRPTGVITYTRRHVKANNLPMWSESDAKLSPLYISSEGKIEDEGLGMVEVDFANKFVGGGVLGRGSVQEEILFLICPELIVCRLFTEGLEDTEALIVTGCERFNKYEGYGQTFKWSGSYSDTHLTRDSYMRFNRVIVAIDAHEFSGSASDQFKLEAINRELNKAYSGFSLGAKGNIATGNWGCGAFKGDPRLKSLLQILAASVCQKGVAYFTFGDTQMRDDIYKLHDFLSKKEATVGMIWQLLREYVKKEGSKSGPALYEYIYETMDSTKSNILLDDSQRLSTPQKIESNLSIQLETPEIGEFSGEVKEEPMSAETYSIKTEEGRKRCLETEQERWSAYQQAMSKFSLTEDNTTPTSTPKAGPVKRKISDYFPKIDDTVV